MLNLKIKQNHARYSFKTIKDRETVETKLNQKTKVPMLISDTGLSMYNNQVKLFCMRDLIVLFIHIFIKSSNYMIIDMDIYFIPFFNKSIPFHWRRFLRVPWIARRSNQSILKEINREYSLEGLMLQLKLQYFGLLMEELIHWKRS